MLINKLKKKYNEIEDKLTNVIDYIYDTMLYEFEICQSTKMKLVISDTIDINKKFYKAIYQKLEQQAKQFNACVVPDLLSDGITWDYDYLKIYRNNLSQFLIEIDEADSYKYLLKNPLVGDDFNETQQSQIIDVLKNVIDTAENGEDHVIVKTEIEGGLLTAVLETFGFKMERISLGEYKFYGWAE